MPFVIHSGTDVGLVRLKVSDLDRSVSFYCEVVGLTLRTREGYTAELGAEGGGRTLVVLEQLAGGTAVPRRKTAGLYHFAILVPDRLALGLSLKRLIEAGQRIGQADHWVSEALYISDPDDNGIEIYHDRPRAEWPRGSAGDIRMATDPIDWEGLLREAGNETPRALPADTKIGHVHLHVSDLEEARRFYCDALGFELITAYGDAALFVSAGGYHHHLGLNTWAGVGAPPAPANAPGLAYFTIELPSESALRETLASLEKAGISAEGEDEERYLVDPSGNRIRLIVSRR
ncbi:VOC family protein [Paenibacillus sp. TRM 82003]|nr:VOC family protein [Paenibacillus sp. TRM 82003]